MKACLRGGSAALLVASLASASVINAGRLPEPANRGPAQASATGPHHTVVAADGIAWKPLRPGAEIAVVSGDPNKDGSPFVLRMRYHVKSRIPPHWHPTDEHLTILSGTFRLGTGTSGDESETTPIGAGGYGFVAAKMPHYGWADANTTIQVHGLGPFAINYVNPADDPNRAGKQ
jgi:quercetin dioxygenase-like cupin family protein